MLRAYLPGRAVLDGEYHVPPVMKVPDMNRLILKYKYPITFAILAVLAWVVYRDFLCGGERAHWVRRRGSHRMGTRHVRFPVLLAAYHVQCLQKSDSSAWARRRPNPRQYAVRGAHSRFALGVKLQLISNRDQRRALHRRLARPLQRAARLARAGHGRPVLQRAVH